MHAAYMFYDSNSIYILIPISVPKTAVSFLSTNFTVPFVGGGFPSIRARKLITAGKKCYHAIGKYNKHVLKTANKKIFVTNSNLVLADQSLIIASKKNRKKLLKPYEWKSLFYQ